LWCVKGITIYLNKSTSEISLLVLSTADRLPINIEPAVSIKAKNQSVYENKAPRVLILRGVLRMLDFILRYAVNVI